MSNSRRSYYPSAGGPKPFPSNYKGPRKNGTNRSEIRFQRPKNLEERDPFGFNEPTYENSTQNNEVSDEIQNISNMEEHLILRCPPKIAEKIRSTIRENKKGEDIEIKLEDNKKNISFKFGDSQYTGTLVSLPCIIEAQKTYDKTNYFKSSDIGQMIVLNDPENEKHKLIPYESHKEKDKEEFNRANNGLTPATKNIRKRKFRKISDNKITQLKLAQEHMEKLTRGKGDDEIIEVIEDGKVIEIFRPDDEDEEEEVLQEEIIQSSTPMPVTPGLGYTPGTYEPTPEQVDLTPSLATPLPVTTPVLPSLPVPEQSPSFALPVVPSSKKRKKEKKHKRDKRDKKEKKLLKKEKKRKKLEALEKLNATPNIEQIEPSYGTYSAQPTPSQIVTLSPLTPSLRETSPFIPEATWEDVEEIPPQEVPLQKPQVSDENYFNNPTYIDLKRQEQELIGEIASINKQIIEQENQIKKVPNPVLKERFNSKKQGLMKDLSKKQGEMEKIKEKILAFENSL